MFWYKGERGLVNSWFYDKAYWKIWDREKRIEFYSRYQYMDMGRLFYDIGLVQFVSFVEIYEYYMILIFVSMPSGL